MKTSFLPTAGIDRLKQEVLAANLELVSSGLVLFTFGNASGIDRSTGQVVIKPSGVSYSDLKPEDMVVCSLDGTIAPGSLRPSSDLETHLHLYREFPEIGGVVHTHSTYATSWAQAGLAIPPYGTTHADYFYGSIPCTGVLSEEECAGPYVLNTGKAITRCFHEAGLNPLDIPAALVSGHAPFVWGSSVADAAHNAIILEAVAEMAWKTKLINPDVKPISQALLDRHYQRKHGVTATYGQEKVCQS